MTTNLVGKRVTFNTAMYPNTQKYAGQVWLVKRKLQVNIEMQRVDANGNTFGNNMRTHPDMVQVVDGNTPVTRTPPPPYTPLTTGAIVRVTGVAKIDPRTLFVVMQDKGLTAKLVKLGGDANRYWPNIPRSMITVVNAADVIK